MKRTWMVAAVGVAVVALAGCDTTSPVRVQDASKKGAELAPGLYRAVPPQSVLGCTWAVHRNLVPVAWGEAHDSVALYAFLPESTAATSWSFSTRGCGTWVRVP